MTVAKDAPPLVITPEAPPPLSAEWVANLAAALRGETTPQAELDWELFEAAVDLIANHYGLHRDDAFDALLDLESAIIADGGQPLAMGLLAEPWGFAVAGLRVAEHFVANADALPALHLSLH